MITQDPFEPNDGRRTVDDEPVFILRASDIVAPDTVRKWADMAERCRADGRMVRRARDLADEMESWAREHGHHVPVQPDVDDRRTDGSGRRAGDL